MEAFSARINWEEKSIVATDGTRKDTDEEMLHGWYPFRVRLCMRIDPVVSLVPCSTTGYRLISLREIVCDFVMQVGNASGLI